MARRKAKELKMMMVRNIGDRAVYRGPNDRIEPGECGECSETVVNLLLLAGMVEVLEDGDPVADPDAEGGEHGLDDV